MSQIGEFLKPLIRWFLLAILVLIALALLIRFLGIRPPREFTIATGREGGAYYNFAQQYQQRFAEEGYTLHIRPTAGSIETIQLLNSGEVDAGLVQNTLYTDFDTSNVNILAAVFNEALWIFYRQDLARLPEHIADLKGLRIGVGEEGSGTLARLLLIIANEVHNRGGILEDTGQFPAPLYNGLPMNADAARYLENGPTGLERYLPLWLASRLERLLFLLLPVVLIAYPLIRGAPSIVAYFNRYRVKRRYVYLRNVEQEYMSYDLEELAAAIEKLEAFQRELNESVNVPTSMLDEYYELRMHTGLTLERLRTQQAALMDATQPST